VDQVNELPNKQWGSGGTYGKNGMELKVKQVEHVIYTLQEHAAETKQTESMDRQSATSALEKAKLPKGILPDDIVSHRAVLIMKKERDALNKQTGKMEEETKVMEQQIAQAEKAVQQKLYMA